MEAIWPYCTLAILSSSPDPESWYNPPPPRTHNFCILHGWHWVLLPAQEAPPLLWPQLHWALVLCIVSLERCFSAWMLSSRASQRLLIQASFPLEYFQMSLHVQAMWPWGTFPNALIYLTIADGSSILTMLPSCKWACGPFFANLHTLCIFLFCSSPPLPDAHCKSD